jgi:hypothetical protein
MKEGDTIIVTSKGSTFYGRRGKITGVLSNGTLSIKMQADKEEAEMMFLTTEVELLSDKIQKILLSNEVSRLLYETQLAHLE